MNKQEFIEKLREHGAWCTECHDINGKKDRYVKFSKVRELLDQLDEPQAIDDTIKPINVQEFTTLTQEMAQTYEAKNADYGNSFDKSLDEFGLVASLVRMTDKLNRAKQLSQQEARVDESMRDTLMDLANYAVMTVRWIDEGVE